MLVLSTKDCVCISDCVARYGLENSVIPVIFPFFRHVQASKKKTVVTRHTGKCSLLGAPKELKGSQLPLCIEVLQHMQYVKEKLSQERGPGVISVIDLAKQTAERVVGFRN